MEEQATLKTTAERKMHQFNFRLGDADREMLLNLAAHHSRSVASLVRWLVRREYDTLGEGYAMRRERDTSDDDTDGDDAR